MTIIESYKHQLCKHTSKFWMTCVSISSRKLTQYSFTKLTKRQLRLLKRTARVHADIPFNQLGKYFDSKK